MSIKIYSNVSEYLQRIEDEVASGNKLELYMNPDEQKLGFYVNKIVNGSVRKETFAISLLVLDKHYNDKPTQINLNAARDYGEDLEKAQERGMRVFNNKNLN